VSSGRDSLRGAAYHPGFPGSFAVQSGAAAGKPVLLFRCSVMTETLKKSERTLSAIVNTALELAITQGLSSMSLGEVAKRLNISKSGVFVRTGSVENLQDLVLARYEQLFAEHVFLPALEAPRGLPRLDRIMELWVGRGVGRKAMAGSLHAVAAFDLHPMETLLRKKVRGGVVRWRRTLGRTVTQAIEEGHLRPDTEPAQVAYEISSLMLGYFHDLHFLRDRKVVERTWQAYQRLISTYKTPGLP
jgi:AcrR family transcriptional regulator